MFTEDMTNTAAIADTLSRYGVDPTVAPLVAERIAEASRRRELGLDRLDPITLTQALILAGRR